MKTTVCFTAKNIYYLKGGGHFWVPLNWSLGLVASGLADGGPLVEAAVDPEETPAKPGEFKA